MNILDVFHFFPDLKANPQKSTCYLSHPPSDLKQWIFNSYEINTGYFPIKFLGVPLITKKLLNKIFSLSLVELPVESTLGQILFFLLQVACN